MTHGAVVDTFVAVLAWAASAAQVPSRALRADTPTRRWLWMSLLAMALAVTAGHPAVYPLIGTASGISNAAWLLRALGMLAAAWTMIRFLAVLDPSTSRQTRSYGLLLAAAGGLVTLLFAAAPARPDTLAYLVAYGGDPMVALCALVYLSSMGLTLARITRAYWRYATVAAVPTTRTGLWLVTFGGLLGMGSLASQLLAVAAQQLPLPTAAARLAMIARLLAGGGVILGALGITLPAWQPRLRAWAAGYRHHRRLVLLWQLVFRRNVRPVARALKQKGE